MIIFGILNLTLMEYGKRIKTALMRYLLKTATCYIEIYIQERADNITKKYANHKCFFTFIDESYVMELFYSYIGGEIEAEEIVKDLQKRINTISAEQGIDS